MNREIKFRAWDGFRMYSPTIVDGKEWNMMEDREILGYPLMQYTGLKDKNGKEIYEGDIVMMLYPKGPIKYFKGSVQFESCEYIASDKRDWMPLNQHGTIEVIGNIYQNPELLSSNNP